MGIINI